MAQITTIKTNAWLVEPAMPETTASDLIGIGLVVGRTHPDYPG